MLVKEYRNTQSIILLQKPFGIQYCTVLSGDNVIETRRPPFAGRYFQVHVLKWELIENFTEVCSQRSNWQYTSIGSDNVITSFSFPRTGPVFFSFFFNRVLNANIILKVVGWGVGVGVWERVWVWVLGCGVGVGGRGQKTPVVGWCEWGEHIQASASHYTDVIMSASQITSLTIVYSTVYSGAVKENIKAPCHWPLCREFTGDRWIPVRLVIWDAIAPTMTSLWASRVMFGAKQLPSPMLNHRSKKQKRVFESAAYKILSILSKHQS